MAVMLCGGSSNPWLRHGTVDILDSLGHDFDGPTISDCNGKGTYTITCDKCDNGTWSRTVKCTKCDGAGKYECMKCDGEGSVSPTPKPCLKCDGDGTQTCIKCDGEGSVTLTATCRKCNGEGREGQQCHGRCGSGAAIRVSRCISHGDGNQ